MDKIINARIQFNNAKSKSEWENSTDILLDNEFGIEKDTYKLKIGDGTSLYKDLKYIFYSTIEVDNLIKDMANTGLVNEAKKLATPRTINDTLFDGTNDITTSKWGETRTIKIGDTSKTVNGSMNYTWNLSDIIKGNLNVPGDLTVTGSVTGTEFIGDGSKLTNLTTDNFGSSTIGNNTKFIYLSNGKFTASTATVGNTHTPVYMNNGTITAIDSINQLAVYGENTITSVTDDTTENWSKYNTSVHFYNINNSLTDQPGQFGYILNIAGRTWEVHQLWFTQATGSIYHRGGNYEGGWYGESWRKILDEVNYTEVIPLAGNGNNGLMSNQDKQNLDSVYANGITEIQLDSRDDDSLEISRSGTSVTIGHITFAPLPQDISFGDNGFSASKIPSNMKSEIGPDSYIRTCEISNWDNNGHIKGGKIIYYIFPGLATEDKDGFMSADDKKKLTAASNNGITEIKLHANDDSLSLSRSGTSVTIGHDSFVSPPEDVIFSGNIVPANQRTFITPGSIMKTYEITNWDMNGHIYGGTLKFYSFPELATASTDGFMAATDKDKFDTIIDTYFPNYNGDIYVNTIYASNNKAFKIYNSIDFDSHIYRYMTNKALDLDFDSSSDPMLELGIRHARKEDNKVNFDDWITRIALSSDTIKLETESGSMALGEGTARLIYPDIKINSGKGITVNTEDDLKLNIGDEVEAFVEKSFYIGVNTDVRFGSSGSHFELQYDDVNIIAQGKFKIDSGSDLRLESKTTKTRDIKGIPTETGDKILKPTITNFSDIHSEQFEVGGHCILKFDTSSEALDFSFK